jgi:hypothetical protein
MIYPIKLTLLSLIVATCIPVHSLAQPDEDILQELLGQVEYLHIDSLEYHAAKHFRDAGMDHVGYAAKDDYALIQGSRSFLTSMYPATWSILLEGGKVRLINYTYATDQYMGSCGYIQVTHVYKWTKDEPVLVNSNIDLFPCSIGPHTVTSEETALLRFMAGSFERLGFSIFKNLYFKNNCIEIPLPTVFDLDNYELIWIHSMPGQPKRVTGEKEQQSYKDYSQVMFLTGMMRRQSLCEDSRYIMINYLYPPDQETSIVHTMSLFFKHKE